jgi:hypothetical protein
MHFTFSHALGFSVSTSRFPATDIDTLNVNLPFAEALFTTHADNSSISHFDDWLGTELWIWLRTNVNTLLRTGWTAFSLSYKLWIWDAEEGSVLYCCPWRRGGHVTPPYCCAIQRLQRRLATRSSRRSEGWERESRHGENVAHYSCTIAFRSYCASTAHAWGE